MLSRFDGPLFFSLGNLAVPTRSLLIILCFLLIVVLTFLLSLLVLVNLLYFYLQFLFLLLLLLLVLLLAIVVRFLRIVSFFPTVIILLGLFDYGLKTLIRHQDPLQIGNRLIDDHTSDILDILLVLVRTDKLFDILIDALADLLLEIWVVFDAGRDETLSLLLVSLLAFCFNTTKLIR